jgi:hypothetical protein
VLAGVFQGRGPEVRAQNAPGAAAPAADRAKPAAVMGSDPSGTIALTVPAPGGSGQWLTLIDTKTRAFAVYRVDPANPKGAVKLEAARQYQWDLKLDEYNNQEPSVAAIESTVKSLGQPKR